MTVSYFITYKIRDSKSIFKCAIDIYYPDKNIYLYLKVAEKISGILNEIIKIPENKGLIINEIHIESISII